MPVASYDPLLLELFRRAAVERISISLPEEKDCHRLRFRLHNMRKAMRKEQHPMLRIAERVSCHVDLSPPGPHLIARPSDTDFLGPLAAAGITIPEAPDADLAPDGATSAAADTSMDSVLKDFFAELDAKIAEGEE